MIFAALDYETYYADDYSLSKTSTQQYILDPRFEVIMLGYRIFKSDSPSVKVQDRPSVVAPQHVPELMAWLGSFKDQLVTVGHNSAVFDESITRWKYGLVPAFTCDTMVMARSLGLSAPVGLSLSKLTEACSRHQGTFLRKGTAVHAAKNKRLADFSSYELDAYGEYCATDVDATIELFNELVKLLPVQELQWQSMISDCYTARPLRVNAQVVEQELQRVRVKRAAMMQTLMTELNVQDNEMLLSVIGSNPKFAEALQYFGVQPPTKRSKTNKESITWAFAKTDPGMLALAEHPDPMVAALATARLGLKSSIEETRCVSLLARSQLGAMPAPYAASGAHTHRLGGTDSTNLQNLPSGRKPGQSKALRESIEPADPNDVFIASDSANIEVRVLDYISGDTAALESFRRGQCPYSTLASAMWPEGVHPDDIKRLAKSGDAIWAPRRQVAKSARLGCQFGIGAGAYVDYCRTQAGLTVSLDEAQDVVNKFRSNSPMITQLWKTCARVLKAMSHGRTIHFGGLDGTLFFADGARHVMGVHIPGIRLPDGMWLSYPGLRVVPSDNEGWSDGYAYDGRDDGKRGTVFLTGPKIAENVTQALATSIMKWQAMQCSYPIRMQTHDENVLIVRNDPHIVEHAKQDQERWMVTAPPWVPGIPLGVETGVGRNYGST